MTSAARKRVCLLIVFTCDEIQDYPLPHHIMLETRMLTASNRRPCLHHPATRAEMIGIRGAFNAKEDTRVPLIPLSHEVIFAISSTCECVCTRYQAATRSAVRSDKTSERGGSKPSFVLSPASMPLRAQPAGRSLAWQRLFS